MYDRKDAYYRKAKKEGYKSRAAYKLMEINQRFRLIHPGYKVLDCGAAPGGWSQVALELVGKNGFVAGADLFPVEGINAENFAFVQGDLTKRSTIDQLRSFAEEYDTVISDAAPNTTGVRLADHVNSLDLVRIILKAATQVLRDNGSFLFKLFDGEDTQHFLPELRKLFKKVKPLRPDATRKNSFEIYVVCTEFKKSAVQEQGEG